MFHLSKPEIPNCKKCNKPMVQFEACHDEDYPDYVKGQAAESVYFFRCDACVTGWPVHTPKRCVDHKCDLIEEKEFPITSHCMYGTYIGATFFSDLRCPAEGCKVRAVRMKQQAPPMRV